MNNKMTLSEDGINKLIFNEGIRLSPYKDSAGKMTIGIGHLITAKEMLQNFILIGNIQKPFKNGISQADCIKLFKQDCAPAEVAVNKFVTRELTQAQFDSLVSFVYQEGVQRFIISTFLEALNANKPVKELEYLYMKWVYAGGKISAGIRERRKREFKAFLV